MSLSIEVEAIQVAIGHYFAQNVQISLLLLSCSREQQGVEAKRVDLAWNTTAMFPNQSQCRGREQRRSLVA
jgi:DNA-binding sugar fermentation-stimulating protein